MCWGDPFGVAVGTFSGGPAAASDQRVIATATKGQVVDVGGAALGVVGDMMDFAVVARHVAAGA